jgi:hypothetical protein
MGRSGPPRRQVWHPEEWDRAGSTIPFCGEEWDEILDRDFSMVRITPACLKGSVSGDPIAVDRNSV